MLLRAVQLFVLTLFLISVQAQLTQVNQLEFEINDDYEEEKLFAFGKTGLIIQSQKEQRKLKAIEYRFELLNENMEHLKYARIQVSKDLQFEDEYVDESNIYLLFEGKKGVFEIHRVDVENMTSSKFTGNLPKKSNVYNLVGIGANVMVRIYSSDKPQLLHINLTSGRLKYFPINIEGLDKRELIFNDLTKVSNSNEVCGTIHAKYSNNIHHTYGLIWNNQGSLLHTYNLTGSNKNNLYTVAMNKIDDGQYSANGTFGDFPVAVGLNGGGSGIYYAITKNKELSMFKEIPFESLENLVNSLSDRSKARLNKHDLRLTIHMHNTELLTNGYLLIGETFERTYRTAMPSDPAFNMGAGAAYGSTSVFDGYQFKDVIMIKMDSTGNVIWDQIIPMYPRHRPMKLRDMVTLNSDGDEYTITCMKHRDIKKASINKENGKITNEATIDNIDNSSSQENKLGISDLLYWYEQYYVAYGIEKIKDSHGKRKVFLILKIEME